MKHGTQFLVGVVYTGILLSELSTNTCAYVRTQCAVAN